MTAFGSSARAMASESHALAADVSVLAPQEPEELDLVVGARREVRVAPFGRDHALVAPAADDQRLAETGAGRDQGPVPRPRFPRLERDDRRIGERPDPAADGLEVVQQAHPPRGDRPHQIGLVDDPRQVGRGDAPRDHRAGDAEARRVDRTGGPRGEEPCDRLLERRKLGAAEDRVAHERHPGAVRLPQRERGLRPPDVSREDHARPPVIGPKPSARRDRRTCSASPTGASRRTCGRAGTGTARRARPRGPRRGRPPRSRP